VPDSSHPGSPALNSGAHFGTSSLPYSVTIATFYIKSFENRRKVRENGSQVQEKQFLLYLVMATQPSYASFSFNNALDNSKNNNNKESFR